MTCNLVWAMARKQTRALALIAKTVLLEWLCVYGLALGGEVGVSTSIILKESVAFKPVQWND